MLTRPTLHLYPRAIRSLMTDFGCHTRGARIIGAPHQVLLTPPPPPPPPRPILSAQPSAQHQSPKSDVSYTFRSPTDSEATLKQFVSALSSRLKNHHRIKVAWPIGHTEYAGRQTERLHTYLTNALVMPCLDLLAQLRAYFVKEPLHQISRSPEDGVSIITFTNAPPFTASLPILVFMSEGLEGASNEFTRSQLLSRYLSEAWKSDPAAKVICSDLKSLFVFRQDLGSGPPMVIYERLSVDPDLVAIQVVITAYIRAALTARSSHSYFAFPSTIKFFDPPRVLGCLPDPSKPILTDEEVFATHDRMSNFDLYTLKSVPSRALQFLRWKTYMLDHTDQIKTLRPGDSVTASTAGFSRCNATLRPYWSVDLESVPASTMEHLRAIGRPPSLDKLTQRRLAESTRFHVNILEPLGGKHATVYRCEITTIDDQPVPLNIPPLCIKLFDDRLSKTYAPDDPDESDVGPDKSMWIYWRTSEDLVRHEHAIYQQLAFAQGAAVPWYYGAHTFVLPDGHWVYGVLLEYVPDGTTVSKAIPPMNNADRCALIQAARHSLRVLQYADVSQHDWHEGQVLVLSSPTPHTVLLDFAWASVSTEPENHATNDYSRMLYILKQPLRSAGMPAASILDHYGKPEAWDTTACTWQGDDGERQLLKSDDPYDWIYLFYLDSESNAERVSRVRNKLSSSDDRSAGID